MQKWQPSSEKPWTILKLLRWTSGYFTERGVEDPRASAEILLGHVLGLRRLDLYLHYDKPLSPGELQSFKALIKRRLDREPVAYIVGTKHFWSLTLRVTPAVLIPRPETECMVEQALALMAGDLNHTNLRILDLGTGSGALILALAAERGDACCFGCDRRPEALTVARENARIHGLSQRVFLLAGDWFSAFRPTGPCFDLIVSNPPYIPAGEIEDLQPEISRYEPRWALDGGADGLAALRQIMAAAPDYLKPDGALLLEIGADQKAPVMDLIGRLQSYDRCTFFQDYAGKDRVAVLRKKALQA